MERTVGTSLREDGTSGVVGSPGGPGDASARAGGPGPPRVRRLQLLLQPPGQDGNCAAPLRARSPTRPLGGSEFQGGGAETGHSGAAAGPDRGGSGGASLRRPGRSGSGPCRGDASRGRGMSQVSAGTPSNPCPPPRIDGELGSLSSPELCDLGQPRTLSGPKSGRTGRTGGGHSESRPEPPAWALERLLRGGALPGPAGCPVTLGIST